MVGVTIDPALQLDFLEEEDFSCVFGFDYKEAWNRLHSFPNVTKFNISSQLQEKLEIVVGRNISDEHRWKAINKDMLEQYFQPVGENEAKLGVLLHELDPGSSILIEYVPEESQQQEEVFLVYSDIKELNEASEIVRKLELFERLKLKLLTEKIFKEKWVSKCADREIEQWKRVRAGVAIETEIQSVYPLRENDAPIRSRNCTDVRDGYLELLPLKWKTVNVQRKITDRGTQVLPPAINRYQQTEPTFPSNAATQYQLDDVYSQIYSSLIPGERLCLSTESLSKEVQFNLVDLYKNEYRFISEKQVHGYQTPQVDEVLSFMNHSMCVGRNVCSMDWHPEQSGIFVASYTFETVTKEARNLPDQSQKRSEDIVNRMIFEKCPVLIWSFDEPLVPLLELKTIREVTAVSFCPYDGDLVVGGLTNGQIVLWDLKGELARVELAKQSAHIANEYRQQIRQLLENPLEEVIDRSLNPAAVSSLKDAPRRAITTIKWLPRNHYCTTTGHLKTHPDKLHRFLVTASLDGSVCFWDLDFSMPALQKIVANTKGSKIIEKTMYQRVNNLFFPTFRVVCQTPIAAMIVDEAVYVSTPQECTKDITKRVKHNLEPMPMSCKMSIMLGTFTGQVFEGTWEGYDFEQGALVNEETFQISYTLNSIHDGPIVALERNPSFQDAFLSIGGHVLALWSDEDCSTAIFWRKKSAMITAARWSLQRVGVFFIGLDNGDFEIWDLNMKTFRASVSMNLGAGALTVISQHRLLSARHCLAIADSNANIRILALPPAFVQPTPDEEENFRDIIRNELARRSSQEDWVNQYYDRVAAKNKDETKTSIDVKEVEPLKIAQHENREEKDQVPVKKKQMTNKQTPLSDRLEQQYRAKQFQNLLKKLMQRRNVSPERMAREMRPEVDRRKYNAEKRFAIDASLSQVVDDFESIQNALHPRKTLSPQPIPKGEERIVKLNQNIAGYHQAELEARDILRGHFLPEMDSFTEVLMKSKQRRDRVCIDVGTNMEHLVDYEKKRNLRRLGAASGAGQQLKGVSSFEEKN